MQKSSIIVAGSEVTTSPDDTIGIDEEIVRSTGVLCNACVHPQRRRIQFPEVDP